MDSLSPNIFVSDIHKTIEFYQLLGFTVVTAVPDPENPVWAMMSCGNVSFMFQTFGSLGEDLPDISRTNGGSLLFYIRIKDIRSFFDRLQDKVTVLHGLQQTFYGATEFSIKDNNGYVLTFSEEE